MARSNVVEERKKLFFTKQPPKVAFLKKQRRRFLWRHLLYCKGEEAKIVWELRDRWGGGVSSRCYSRSDTSLPSQRVTSSARLLNVPPPPPFASCGTADCTGEGTHADARIMEGQGRWREMMLFSESTTRAAATESSGSNRRRRGVRSISGLNRTRRRAKGENGNR